MSRECRFKVVGGGPGAVIIKDLGPWDQYMTVTNAAEDVVACLFDSGDLKPGQRLFYYDSENEYGELLIKDGKFVGFAPAVAP